MDVSVGADVVEELAETETTAEADVCPDLTGTQPRCPNSGRDGLAVALVESAAQETTAKTLGPAELTGKAGTSAVAEPHAIRVADRPQQVFSI